jgi:16S rRNA (guanine527-N7)-methyltransferase
MNKKYYYGLLVDNLRDLLQHKKKKFDIYSNLLQEWNKRINLTSILDDKEIYLKHFYDSLTCFKLLPFLGDYSLIDLGTGAGLPGIPLKIINPAIRLTLSDSVRKKLDFCEIVVKELSLADVKTVHARAEDLGQDYDFREKFDWSVARAVADLSVLTEYLLPLTRVGGHALVMKGTDIQQEVDRANGALSLLGGRIITIETFSLPENSGERSLVLIEKVKQTPSVYPRKAGTPSKKPLS